MRCWRSLGTFEEENQQCCWTTSPHPPPQMYRLRNLRSAFAPVSSKLSARWCRQHRDGRVTIRVISPSTLTTRDGVFSLTTYVIERGRNSSQLSKCRRSRSEGLSAKFRVINKSETCVRKRLSSPLDRRYCLTRRLAVYGLWIMVNARELSG